MFGEEILMASTTKTVLALGEILWDVLPTEKLLGGAPANFCHRLRQLGVNARMVSRVGVDQLGDDLLAGLEALHFDLSLVQRDPRHPTGTVDVSLSSDGEPTFVINAGVAYDHLEPTPQLLTAAASADLICYGTLVQRSERTRSTLYKVLDAANHAIRFLDINLRKNCYSLETVQESLRRADILKLNTSEVGILNELLGLNTRTPQEFADQAIERFKLETVLVTLGSKGVYARGRDGGSCAVPGVSISVVDTIGSGDSFAAGFVYKRLLSAPLEECCHFGNLIGALNATKKGGMPNVSPAEVSEFVAQHSV
jgi:fructokinase